jgi:hypothetical protein
MIGRALMVLGLTGCAIHGGPDVAVLDDSCSVASAPELIHIQGADADQQILGLCNTYDSLPKGLTVQGTDWTDLSALDCFCDVDGQVAILNNPNLESLRGLPLNPHLTGGLLVTGNPQLASLRGLEDLVQVDGHLVLTAGQHLADMWGLHRLTTVEGDLVVRADGDVLDIEALGAVRHVGGRLAVVGWGGAQQERLATVE